MTTSGVKNKLLFQGDEEGLGFIAFPRGSAESLQRIRDGWGKCERSSSNAQTMGC